jgi:hypothetical protein
MRGGHSRTWTGKSARPTFSIPVDGVGCQYDDSGMNWLTPPHARTARLAIASYILALTLASESLAQPAAEKAQQATFTGEQLAFFEKDVRPVLVEHCMDCHSGDEPESSFSVESREALLLGGQFGPALRPGEPKRSLLISAIKHDEFLKMPPKEKLSSRQVIDLTRWVEMGAPWPDSQPTSKATSAPTENAGDLFTDEQRAYWAFQKPTRPLLPHVGDTQWPQTAIDYFVLARLEAAGLTPAPRADKRTLIRRATFDLTGLPPTPAEVEAFLSDDSPLAYERLIDRLLGSPRYGERWGRHWLDVARYADSNGLDENIAYAHAFRYRDYVIASFNRDKPYARFVQEQIAGDLLPATADPRINLEQLLGTGFLAIGAKMLAEDDPAKMQMDIIDEQLSTVGQTFLGLTLGCARCHDHKFDPLPTADYYSLAGIFKSSKTMENHKVVAVWYERPLVTAERAAEIEQWQAALNATQSSLQDLQAKARERIAKQVRSRTQQYLLASRSLAQLESTQQGDQRAATKQQEPFQVANGYAAIEAEAFHAGNVVSSTDGYGEGIGVIATSGAGFAEYQLDVERAGTYALEVRYAAALSRPLSVLLNGEKAADNVLGGVTGTWFPDSQRWSVEARIRLESGMNTLKFNSGKVYPHIDKLALVLVEEPWPFETSRPVCLSFSLPSGIQPVLAAAWRDYFEKLEKKQVADHVAFIPWLTLRSVEADDFSQEADKIVAEIQSNSGLGAMFPAGAKQFFGEAPIRSIEDLAGVYQRLVDAVDVSQSADGADQYADLRKEFTSDPSPLSGPVTPPESLFPTDLKTEFAKSRSEQERLNKSKPQYDVAMGVTEATPNDIRVHLRGNHITLGDVAPRRMPRILAAEDQFEIPAGQSGRLQLAQWLTHDDHPLIHRVMVNRIWRWKFGRGIVASVDNFGQLGEQPTHPELLDWLAVEFVGQGGSIKWLQRALMLSSTYQMSTTFNEMANAKDPQNRLLWRMSRRRLSGEELRDSVLFLGPGLNSKMGDTLLKVKNRAYVTVSGTNITDEYDNQRRSVYLPVVRSAVYDVFQTLDFPDPAVANGDRATTTVAPQALLLMNSELVATATSRIAQRLLADSSTERVTKAYDLLVGRSPSELETDAAHEFVARIGQLALSHGKSNAEAEQMAWQSFCRVLLSSNEFSYIE